MFDSFFSSSKFMPHGHCYLWSPGILWSHVISDTLIALAYFSIPLALMVLVKKRGDLHFTFAFKLFALFIVSCGIGHAVDVWNIWHAEYWLSAFVRIVTAFVSVLTAVVVWPLIPEAMKIPSTLVLQREIEKKQEVEKELEAANKNLEEKIENRTHELEAQKEILSRSHDVMVDREFEMIKLKQEVNSLCEKLGEPERYTIVSGS